MDLVSIPVHMHISTSNIWQIRYVFGTDLLMLTEHDIVIAASNRV